MGDRCLQCGFEYDSVTPVGAPVAIRGFPAPYREALEGADPAELLRVRPGPWIWSALEYTCHVRDVFSVYAERARLVLAENEPYLPSMQRDERAARERYNEQDAAVVLDQLAAEADGLAEVLAEAGPDGWERVGDHQVSGRRPLLWMAANAVHEGRHHLGDVQRVLDVVGEEETQSG
jgi:DinB family protein